MASKTFTNGLSGIWYQWLWLFASPFYWLIAPVMRRFRAYTTADVFEARFSRSVAMLFALVGTLNLTFNIGIMLKGSGAVISASTGGRRLGMDVTALTAELALQHGYAAGTRGVLITGVDKESDPAEKGIASGMMITHVEGKEVSTLNEYREALPPRDKATRVAMTVLSPGEQPKQVSLVRMGLSSNFAILIIALLCVLYGMAGGLSAAIVTDFFQGILTIIFSFLLLPFVLSAVGGMSGLHAKITDPGIWSLAAPAEIGVFYIAIIALNALVGIVTQPHTMGNCAAGRTEAEGQFGFMVGSLVKRVCTIAWTMTGLAAIVYFGGERIKGDEVYGIIAGDFLPAVLPGLLGVFIAALLASVMSSCDSFMIASSALFTENLYKRLIPGRSPRHYVWVARMTSLAIVAGGLGFAFWLPNVVEGLEIFWKIAPMMAIAFWLGLFWRRATVAGAWASTLVAFATWMLSGWGPFVEWLQGLPVAESWQLVFVKNGTPEMYLPWQMLFYLTTGTIAGIVVSLFTRPVDAEKLERFYALVRTPVRPGEQPPEPCTLPADAVVPPRRVLLPSTSLEIPIPSKGAVAGFLAGWGAVGALIGVFVWIVS